MLDGNISDLKAATTDRNFDTLRRSTCCRFAPTIDLSVGKGWQFADDKQALLSATSPHASSVVREGLPTTLRGTPSYRWLVTPVQRAVASNQAAGFPQPGL